MYACAYTGNTEFEWDRRKAASNFRKHRVDFADAVAVLEDPIARTLSEHRQGEERFVSIGVDLLGRTLVVVYTWKVNGARLDLRPHRHA